MATVKSRNPKTVIKPQELQRLITLLANDIQLRFNPVIERWQVYQVQTSPLVQLDGMPQVKGLIMWTIEEDNGDFREPMQMDYDRVVRTLENYKLLQKLGPDEYANRLDKRDIAREDHINPDAEDKLRAGAKEMANVMYKKQTHYGMNRSTRRASK